MSRLSSRYSRFRLVALVVAFAACGNGAAVATSATQVKSVRHPALQDYATIVAIVSNEGATAVEVEHTLGETCVVTDTIAGANGDARLASVALAVLKPRAWFARWRMLPWPDGRCDIESSVKTKAFAAGEWMVGAEAGFELRSPDRLSDDRISRSTGSITSETSVIREIFSDGGYEPTGSLLAVHVRVQNESSDWKSIAIVQVDVHCKDGGSYASIIGPGAGDRSVTSGPIDLEAKSWGVLSHRFRGTGDPAACNAQIKLAESIRDKHGLARLFDGRGVSWHTTIVLDVNLEPAAEVQYAQ